MKNNAQGTMVIGGKERPYHVNSTRQTQAFTDQLGIELDEYWQKMSKLVSGKPLTNSLLAIVFVYSALHAGAVRQYRQADFTYDDVVDWVEDMDGEADTAEFVKPFNALGALVEEKKS